MKTGRLTWRDAQRLRAAARAGGRGDGAAKIQALDAFLKERPETRGFETNGIVPKGDATKRIFAQIRSETEGDRFLRVTPLTSELRFFRHCGTMGTVLAEKGIHIVRPDVALTGFGRLSFVAPFHDFMIAERTEMDPVVLAVATAHLNAAGAHLPPEVQGSTQQRRTANLPNLIRRTVLSLPFLRNERDVLNRTVAVLRAYHRVQRDGPRVFCHGDVAVHNAYRYRGETYFIDFENYLFAAPGFDLAKVFAGEEDRLDPACAAYADASRMVERLAHIRLAAVYGHFLIKLKRASKGRDRPAFRAALARLEEELKAF